MKHKISIDKKEMLPNLYSPIREQYPNGAKLSLEEILRYTVSKSDNVGCDVLLKLIGGPKAVENFLHQHGFSDVSVKFNEEKQQESWELQFQTGQRLKQQHNC